MVNIGSLYGLLIKIILNKKYVKSLMVNIGSLYGLVPSGTKP